MSFELQHFIIHRLHKNSQDQLVTALQEQEISKNETAELLVEELHNRFNAKPSKGIGKFSENSDSPFPEALISREENGFVPFSQMAARTIAEKMESYGLAAECYLLVAEYRFVAQHFILISEVPVKEKLTCNEEMELGRFRFLDADAMQLAVRFDVMNIATGQQNFATFIKGRAGRKVADFFLDAMAIEELVDRKEQALQLSQVVTDYCEQHVEQKDIQKELKKEVVSYCKEVQDAGEVVELTGLSDVVSQSSDISFTDFIASSEQTLPEQMEPEIKTLKQMTRLTGTGKGVSIGFDANLLGDRIRYDVNTDTLTIKEIPPNLKEQLLRHLGD